MRMLFGWLRVGRWATLFFSLFFVHSLHGQTNSYKILVFSKTAGFRHSSIPDGIAMIQTLGNINNFIVDATEDSAAFTDTNLAQYKAVVFLSTTGDVLDPN